MLAVDSRKAAAPLIHHHQIMDSARPWLKWQALKLQMQACPLIQPSETHPHTMSLTQTVLTQILMSTYSSWPSPSEPQVSHHRASVAVIGP